MQKSAYKTLIQCDFDGTLTEEDISFLILDAFADGDWHSLLDQYKNDIISVGSFNTQAFKMVKESEQTLTKFVRQKSQLRPNFPKLLNYCRNRGFRFVIVSNGLTFYIKTILNDIGINDVEIYAASAEFSNHGIESKYIGPNGLEVQNGFKEAYIKHFVKDGYRITSIGNGASDIPTARLSQHAFATEPMLSLCREMKVDCIPFESLDDIIKGLENLG